MKKEKSKEEKSKALIGSTIELRFSLMCKDQVNMEEAGGFFIGLIHGSESKSISTDYRYKTIYNQEQKKKALSILEDFYSEVKEAIESSPE